MVPLAGWTAGRDIVLRRAHGQLRNAAELAAARRERRDAVAALTRLLVQAGLWPAGRAADGADRTSGARCTRGSAVRQRFWPAWHSTTSPVPSIP
jgi:hypothetical protein